MKIRSEFQTVHISKEHNINTSRSLPDCFVRYIVELSKKHKENIAVLIDEYDKPLIDHIGKGEDRFSVAKENREKERSAYVKIST